MCEIDSSWRCSLAISFWDLRLNPLQILGGGNASTRPFLLKQRARGGERGEADESIDNSICGDLGDDFIRNGWLGSNGPHYSKKKKTLQCFLLHWCVVFVKLTGEAFFSVQTMSSVQQMRTIAYIRHCCTRAHRTPKHKNESHTQSQKYKGEHYSQF